MEIGTPRSSSATTNGPTNSIATAGPRGMYGSAL
jgi:hypothetical protein